MNITSPATMVRPIPARLASGAAARLPMIAPNPARTGGIPIKTGGRWSTLTM